MADKIKLEVVTPERVVANEHVDFVVAPGVEGEIGILPFHAPLITSLDIGILRYTVEGKTEKIALSGGFLEVKGNKVVVLANAAERGEEIDVERAQRALERARERLARRTPDIDVLRAELAMRRALNRLKAAGKM
ncbi:F0F1 ATP synthase subunit epsilon [Carboxydothermus hydrogenoformans]|uniref:ATP synthase epsilon chain n=1 Tax=Carboxydothermus hydrogenoformans (strain ATCC BAA-161 / DSM 6008 / Z-2901) TaxID=246194 RepID=ATPE_CARHZ|nr:F0F1 ATP synthase subunit epsilon [Carboxydothermus hydrogenoformans]Q3A947.1 RecName: Full=ATP synthase epsilon chain; AltName: Full=ATP synthase F1 sector epsilon subunit; AltName: Full=F-ATPase epsilon subunit [Carboxydothermus hydrogenoformans Z-2901]ABB15344.1 ATP synthase F1, epsilon subunit [Carboxydothermus hydrogenoformans Z-2901]